MSRSRSPHALSLGLAVLQGVCLFMIWLTLQAGLMVQTTPADQTSGNAFLISLSVANIVLLVSPAIMVGIAACQLIPESARNRLSAFANSIFESRNRALKVADVLTDEADDPDGPTTDDVYGVSDRVEEPPMEFDANPETLAAVIEYEHALEMVSLSPPTASATGDFQLSDPSDWTQSPMFSASDIQSPHA